ncbi:hypothetical protein KQ51_00805 [Candidatus Izimaplasma bacterium HR1]|jgi:hypothetical protein|uniref:hypothetical protein n=1 Tax=Candidatus Izimoplasma sp. HR1 TaxID=1541959 RepID=UPI0004F74D9C|nr:hypothetical protein KQ51_00805 [Candidatus Izimaplasma bacterium HR1]
MNKGTVIRAGIIFGLFVIILGAAWIVSSVKDKNDSAAISDPSEAYLTVGDYTVTNQELWERMLLNDGISYLTQYIEKEFFFASEIAEVTVDEVNEKIEFYKYGTNDETELADIFADEDVRAKLEKQFEDSMKAIDYDPSSIADLTRFVELEIAKENYVRAYVTNASDDDDLAITNDDLETYYEENYFGDVCAINLKFNSETEAKNVFNEFLLVPNYNSGWGLYDGTDGDIADLGTGDFDEDNTVQLTEEEVLTQFIKMYNYMNPSKPEVLETETEATICLSHTEEFTYNYNDMYEGQTLGSPYSLLANYMFDTLNFDDDGARFSFTLQGLGEFEILTYKVSQEEVPVFADLTQTELDDLKLEIVDSYMTTTIITNITSAVWDDAEFEIFEPILKIKHVANGGDEYNNSGSTEKIATINGTDITADMLFAYMEDKIGTYYTIDMMKTIMLLNSDAYTEIYEGETDYLNSSNETIVGHRDEFRTMKTAFGSGAYASYGFDNSIYSWDEFLILAFGADNENDAIFNLFVLGNLQAYLVGDTVDYAKAANLIQTQVDEYFNLDIVHLLVYTDMDNDLTPDEFNDYVDGLTGQDLLDYEAIKNEVESVIEDKLDDEMNFSEIVDEFNDSLIGDTENPWANAKAYGFHILTQDLSSTDSLTNINTTSYDEDFVAAVKDLYDEYVFLLGASATDVDELYDDELIQTNFGLHYLYSEQGSAFEMPTAVYSESDDLDSEYPIEANGDTLIPNAIQVGLYIEIETADQLGKATDAKLPTSVYQAIDAFYGATYDSYYSSGYYQVVAAQYILDNNGTYGTNNTDSIAYLNDVIGVLLDSTFPEGFIVD